MTIWYDLSGLVEWQKPHLGGIERTAAGILAGLLRRGVEPRLVHIAPNRQDFAPVELDDLPAVVREAVMGPGAPAPRLRMPIPSSTPRPAITVSPPPAPAHHEPRRRPIRDAFYGPGPEGQAFRAAWHAFKATGRDLLHQAGRRAGLARLRPGTTTLALPHPTPSAIDVAAPPPPTPEIPFATGDLLVSCGGTFGMPGHPHAVEAAQAQGVRVIRMVYDLVPVTKPHWLAPRAGHVAWLRHVVTRSELVLVISEYTRREVDAYCRDSGLASPRMVVVRLGDVMPVIDADLPPPLPRFVPPRPFFLCVSTLDVRKNHRCLYDAWSALAAQRGDRCPDLLCVGMPHAGVGDLLHEIRHDPAVNRHLHLLHGIRDAELAWYYRHCVATIYPSKHEGWGLPVAESLAHGKLCLASSAASIPEIAPHLPEYFAPHDAARLVSLVARATDDPNWLADREARIRHEFHPTTWTDTATAVLAALDDLDAGRKAA